MADPYHFEVRVYYEDTDFSGNVYHAAYLKFFERGRSEWLRALGIHHSALAAKGLAFAVTDMEIHFAAAARIDDLLDIETSVSDHSGVRMHLHQTIRRGPEILTKAEVTIVTINADNRPVRLPEALRNQLIDPLEGTAS